MITILKSLGKGERKKYLYTMYLFFIIVHNRYEVLMINVAFNLILGICWLVSQKYFPKEKINKNISVIN